MDLEVTFDRLRRDPPFVAPIHDDVRFEKLSRFPYVVYFRQLADRIEVLAVLHNKRNPRIWQRRANRESDPDRLDDSAP